MRQGRGETDREDPGGVVTRTDYTKMRVGRVIERWTYAKPDGTRAIGKRVIVKCPTCAKNAYRRLSNGMWFYVHSEEHRETDLGFVVRDAASECRVPAVEADKLGFDGYYCVEVGCWRAAGRGTQGRCLHHQRGPSEGAIRKSIEALLESDRLAEPQFAELLGKLRRKLGGAL